MVVQLVHGDAPVSIAIRRPGRQTLNDRLREYGGLGVTVPDIAFIRVLHPSGSGDDYPAVAFKTLLDPERLAKPGTSCPLVRERAPEATVKDEHDPLRSRVVDELL